MRWRTSCTDARGAKKMVTRRTLLIVTGATLCSAAILVALLVVYEPVIPPITRPDPNSFTAPLVQKGAVLAEIGDCAVCHTAERGAFYAGGRPLATPFGTLYATNITPDEKTGIGSWSPAAFRRAMREGVSRSGKHLYPALPYEHFTHVTDADLDALYAFLMSRPSVAARAPENKLIPPLGFRPLLAGWKLLFLHDKPFVPTLGKSAEWNRGAYLVEGLGHCGGCHTPRNIAGGEVASHSYAGGTAEGWNAPPLDASNPAAKAWGEESLLTYFRTGIDANHGAAAGPMGPVTHGLSSIPEANVRAISTYVASLMAAKSPFQPVDRATGADESHPTGAALFAGACASCHGPGAPMAKQGRPSLSLVSALQETDPLNTIQVILQGLQPPIGARGPYMPAFSDNLTNSQIAGIVAYLRARYSDRPAWSSIEDAVAHVRTEGSQP
jgi:mono/diheme cytochrome c family protein